MPNRLQEDFTVDIADCQRMSLSRGQCIDDDDDDGLDQQLGSVGYRSQRLTALMTCEETGLRVYKEQLLLTNDWLATASPELFDS